MPLLKSCLCCSLLQGSIVTGVYTTIIYLAAFVMELCLVLEGENWANSGREKGPLPLPAYILVVLHFTVVGLSIIMLYALYQRRVGILLAWVFVFTLFFFPELGIILFLVVFHWGLQNTYGIIEIAFYLVRAPVNVLCIMCVHSLHSLWKNDLSTERSLKKLSNLQMVKERNGKQSYKNAGFMGSAGDVSSIRSISMGLNNSYPKSGGDPNPSNALIPNGSARKMPSSISSLDIQRDSTMGRRLSMASHLSDSRGLYQKGQLPVDFMPAYRMGYPLSWDPLYLQGPLPDSGSEFNASLYPVHSKIGSMPILSHSRSEQTVFQPPHRLLYPGYALGPSITYGLPRYPFHSNCAQSYDFYDMGTMSRSLLDPDYSTGCRRHLLHSDFSTQSLDRRRCMRRSHSFSLDPYPGQGFNTLQSYYGYPRLQESKSSLGAGSDDFRRYRDVAL